MGAEVYRNQIIQSVVAPDLVPYCLRHTYCTDLQRAGVPLNVAKYLMGHSDVSVTGNIYTDTTPDVINFAAAKMNNFYRDGRGESQTENEMNLIADELL
jgi:site-specific recombinase XerD